MKAGLIYEIESVKPHAADHEYRVFWETMEQIELADKLGFDSVWTVEHHFLNEFSYCSAPEVFLASVAQRTRQIRIGHGVVVLPFSHPSPCGGTDRRARHHVEGARRVRHRARDDDGRAARLRRDSRGDAAAMGRGGRGDSADVARGSVHDAWRVLDGRAAGVGDSKTDSETASADLGRGDQSYDLRAGCRSRARRVVFHARGRAAAGGGANQYLSRDNQGARGRSGRR